MEGRLNIILTSDTSEPIYQQIVKQLQQAIFNGDLRKGEALPSIRTLAKDLKVSVITIKRAYEELERSSMISTIPGKGSFVTESNHDALLEKRKFILEEQIEEIVKEALSLSMNREEINEIVKFYFDEA